MKQVSRRAKKVLIALGLLSLAIIGLTIAFYSSQKKFKNEFGIKEPGVAIYEKFNPTDHWVPGEEKSKQAWFTNTGEMDMLLRFKLTPEWIEKPKDKEGNTLPDNVIKPLDQIITLYWKDSQNGEVPLPKASKDNPVIIPTQGSGFDFIAVYDKDEDTTYYYYTKILKAKGSDGSSTQHVLESVKFSSELSNDGHKNSDYSNTQINLTITGETVLVDERAVEEQWPGVSVSFIKNEDGIITGIADVRQKE